MQETKDVKDMKFRIKPIIDGMRIQGVRYPPGSVVELPESYIGAKYLEPVKETEPVTETKAVAEEQKPKPKGRKA